MSRLNSAIRNIHRLDDLAARDSFLTRLHPLAKLLATVAYLVATLSFTRHDLTGLLGMSLPLILLYQAEGLSISGCLRQFRPVILLLAAVGAANLLFAKEPAVQLGGFAVSGAWITFAVLLGKGVFCFLAVYLLMESTGINGVCCALQQLHVPRVMVVTLLLIYRYLILLLQEGGRISTAYALRAPGQNGIHYRAWGSLAGQLLLRSIDRAQNVYESMQLRGFSGTFTLNSKTAGGAGPSICFAAAACVYCVVFRAVPVFELLGRMFG